MSTVRGPGASPGRTNVQGQTNTPAATTADKPATTTTAQAPAPAPKVDAKTGQQSLFGEEGGL